MKLNASVLVLLGAGLVSACAADTVPAEDAESTEIEGETAAASQAVVTSCPWTAPAVSWDRELMIRSLSVVEDQCRTTHSSANCSLNGYSSTSLGKWTFKRLMEGLAGDNEPREFVGRWLSLWEAGQTNVNGLGSIAARTNIREVLIKPWIKATSGPNCGPGNELKPVFGANGCLLDLTKAPFRLLAVVPRIDMAGSSGAYGGLDPSNPGELRFVFGAVNLDQIGNSMHGALNATAIFEYKLTPARSLLGWGQAFHALGALDLGTKTSDNPYKKSLEKLVDLVVNKNALAGAPNTGSALGQLRTNEIDFDPNKNAGLRIWQLREHRLTDCGLGASKCFLALSPVVQTPHNTFNRTISLDTFLASSQSAILAETQVLTPALGTLVANSGSGAVGTPNEAVHWTTSNAFVGNLNPLARHLFGLSTCNGCHYTETGFDRMHVKPRKNGQVAQVSQFLHTGLNSTDPDPADPMSPLFSWSISDPISGETREFNEPWRRICEMRRVLAGATNPWTRTSGAH